MLAATRQRSRQAARARRTGISLAYHVVLTAGALLTLYPLIWMLSSSFKPESDIFSHATEPLPAHPSFANYAVGWSALQEPFGLYIANSALVAGLAVLGNLLSCSLVAYAFAKLRFPLRRTWFAIMLSTVMLPYHVVMVPQYVLFFQLHWVGTYLPLIVPHFLATDAFFIFLLVQFMRAIPRDIEDAARVDGCGPFRAYWYITLPLSRGGLIATAVLTFLWSWDDFLAPLIYLANGATYTVPLALRMFLNSVGESVWGPMFAMSVVSLVPVLVCFFVFQRQIVEGIATSGLKT